MTQVKWQELTELRERFGGDKHAINRHSVRYYKVDGNDNYYMLDRNNSCCPPCFELVELEHDPRKPLVTPYVPKTIKIDNQRDWGDGLSWPEAEVKALARVQELFDEVAC